MAPTLRSSEKLRRPSWNSLPTEVQLPILEALKNDGYPLSRVVTVSREWQAEIERLNFARIRLTPSRLVDFPSVTRRNRALIRHIWFCLELEDDDGEIRKDNDDDDDDDEDEFFNTDGPDYAIS